MIKEFAVLKDSIDNLDAQSIVIARYSAAEGGTRNLFEADFYRETRLAQEKQNSSILNLTLNELIKAIVPLK